MMKIQILEKSVGSVILALSVLAPVGGYSDSQAGPIQLSRVTDGKTWRLSNATADPLTVEGKDALRLTAAGDSGQTKNAGLALTRDAEFNTGDLELDLKGKNHRPSFLGVVFNVIDEKTFEGIYFRPFNFKAEEPFRNRAVQYIAWPDHTWEELRIHHPGGFEHAINPIPDPDGWFHARIEVTEKQVRVFVNRGQEPCLTVNRLAQSGGHRPVGLFVDVADGLFANLTVKPATASQK